MSSMATKTLLTVEQFEQLPREEARRFELDEGELVDVSGAILLHNLSRDRFARILHSFVQEHGLGVVVTEQEFRLGVGIVRRPDVALVGAENAGRLRVEKRIQDFAPDLVVEIASDSDTFTGLMRKVRQYLDNGVQMVLVVNLPLAEIHVFDRDGRSDLLRAGQTLGGVGVLPGFSCRVERFFDPGA